MSKIIWPVLSVLVAAGIFFSSALSGEVSGGASMVIAELVRYVVPDATDETISVFNFIVRKGAHFTVYFVLAFCVAHSLKFYLLRRSEPALANNKAQDSVVAGGRRLLTLFFVAWGIASAYGVVDEIHQYFVPGRVMALMDMVINAIGAAAGAAVVCWWVARGSSKVSIGDGMNTP